MGINCEDIAFNLMVANATGHPPIKVGPRKKFKCSTPACLNSGMLSASAKHLEERSSCLDKFVKIYGHNPLKSLLQSRSCPLQRKFSNSALQRYWKHVECGSSSTLFFYFKEQEVCRNVRISSTRMLKSKLHQFSFNLFTNHHY